MTETLCVCGHAAEPHQHHRDRRDCSRCGRELCREFRPLTWWRRVLNRVGWYPAPLPDPVPAVDLTSLFTPSRFQVVPLDADGNRVEADWVQLGPSAGVERVWSPEQWAEIASALVPASEQPTLSFAALVARDADGHPISIGDWVQFLDGGKIGEVVATLGQWCEVRIPTSSAPRAEHGTRLRVIVEEES